MNRYGLFISYTLFFAFSTTCAMGQYGLKSLMFAYKNGHITEREFTTQTNCNLNSHDERGRTMLMMATCLGWKDFVGDLLNSLAKPNLQDADGWTALMYAVLEKNAEIVALLLKFGADIGIQNHRGQMAIDLVKQGSDAKSVAICNMLRAYASLQSPKTS